MLSLLEWFGAISGIIGALLLSLNIKISPWAYILFLVSNLSLGVWAWQSNAMAILVMQAVLAVISAIGIYRWMIHPAFYHQS